MITASGSFLVLWLVIFVISLLLSQNPRRKLLPQTIGLILFSLSSVIWLASFNLEFINLSSLSISLLFSLLVFILIRNPLILSLFFLYGHLFIFFRTRFMGDLRPGVNSFLILAYLVIFLFLFITRQFKKFNQVFRLFINLFSIAVLCFFGFKLINHFWFTQPPNFAQDKPDVYYLIFDEYPRNDVLKEQFNFDNTQFTDFLESKGFFIASKARANYPITFLSLSSSLSMNYINYFADHIGTETRNYSYPYQLIRNNPVKQFFKSQGYQIIDYSNRGWNALRTGSQYADQDLFFDDPYYLLKTFLSTTAFNPFMTADILQPYLPEIIKPNPRQLALTTLEKLKSIPKNSNSTFTFAHIFIPHYPYYFDAQGNPVKGDIDHLNRQLFLDQLKFANQNIQEIVTTLLANSKPQPIIVLQSDTGPGFHKPIDVAVEQLTSEQISERYSILNAYYLPDGGDQQLYDSISPVNSFRIILNYYFDQNLDLLEDHSYFATYKYPYRFYLLK